MAISSLVALNAQPNLGTTMYVFTYTKTGATDTFNVATGTAIKNIVYAKAQIDADGSDDPITWSGTTVTFSTGTGAGRLFVVGKGQ
jgi:hypothetical protein